MASSVHATCVLLGEQGVLIRGRSGAGKSALARSLVAEARRRGLFARLVGDDRITLEAAGGRLIARGHPAVAGLIEARGLGLIPEAPEPAAVLRLAVDLIEGATRRLPGPGEGWTTIEGIGLPLLTLGPSPDRADLTFAALSHPPAAPPE